MREGQLSQHTSSGTRPGFVAVRDGRFYLGDSPHHFIGANLWCAAHLGADAPFGDRGRLRRELDRLKDIGVRNLRILGASELSPLHSAVRPALHDKGGDFNQELLGGLDFALAEMKKRGLRAVIYLTNFWEWSGGMMTYLYWTNGGRFIDMVDPAHPWPAFPDFAAGFYSSEEAIELYNESVRTLVQRSNSITGERYTDDDTLFAWQLANEPRPGVSPEVVERQFEAYCGWIRSTARLIKSLDPHHLVSTGSEGLVGSGDRVDYYLRAHDTPDIDYLTAHIWPQNWGWVRPDALGETFAHAERLTQDYIREHVQLARELGRPLVIEEFGFPRDEGRFAPSSTMEYRDRFYALIYGAVAESIRTDGPLMGSNFWAFGGEGRAVSADFLLRPGESHYLGDPPHEPQGWYSVFDTDHATLNLIRRHARALETS